MHLIDKLMYMINHQSSSLSSFAGRTRLIKSVLFAFTNYWLQCLPLPKKVIRKIEAICRTFIWSGTDKITRKSPIAWKKVCFPKRHSGLNIIYLENWNKACLIKLLWNMHGKSNSMWIKWIYCYYVKDQDIQNMAVRSNSSWTLKSILKIRNGVITNPECITWCGLRTSKLGKCMMGYMGICKRSVGGECSIMLLLGPIPSLTCGNKNI